MSNTHSTLTALFTDIANAIREKDGTTTQKVADAFPAAIRAIPSGGQKEIPKSGVIFIDFDGAVAETWKADEVSGKTALPSNPTHEGLVGEGWDWSLTNIKSYVSAYPNAKVTVGQMYHTVSGLTEIDITVTKVTGLTVTCNMVGNKNWGDGTTNTQTTHTYTDYGSYTITCNGTTIPAGTSSAGGLFGSSTSNSNRFWCTAIRIGGSVTSIGNYAFNQCHSFATITIPNSVTSIGNYAFGNCRSLTALTIPNNVTSIGTYALQYCYSLTAIAIPNGITSIRNYAFYHCYSLTTIAIPNGVTSIGTYAFSYCHSLTTIAIPNGVTSISTYAFSNCYSINEYNFTKLTAIPTLSNTNAFNNINEICKIIVPDALYNNWIVATNWATYADYIYKASEVA